MRSKSFEEAIEAAKKEYFAAADRLIEKHGIPQYGPEALRELLKKYKKPGDVSQSPKTAS